MNDLTKLSDSELRKRAISLNETLTNLAKYSSKEELEEITADIDLIHEERERRHKQSLKE
jgi:hypothetical protein